MGIDRLEDSGEDPARSAGAGPHRDTGRPGDVGPSGEVPQSGDAHRPGEPDHSSRESPDTGSPETKRGEPRTRNEYADYIRPPGSLPIEADPPIEEDAPERDVEEPSRQEGERCEASPSDHRHTEEPHSAEEPSEQHGEEHWDVEHSLEPEDSAGSTDHACNPDNPRQESGEPKERNHNPTDAEHGKTVANVVDNEDLVIDKTLVDKEVGDDVVDRLQKAHAADLATDHANTTDPDNKQWTAERNRIHGEIVQDLLNSASAVPCEYKAIIAGGLPGAGKTTILTEQAGINLSNYLTINPDDIKEVLANRELIPEIKGLSPMEASDLAHEESSVIAKHLAHRAQAAGKNIIWDITMSRLESTQERIDSLRASGYRQIDAVFVDIPIEVSIKRTQARHREGQDSWRVGNGMGGRFVPPEIIREQTDPEWGSKNKKNFENIKPSVNNWTVLDNGVDRRRAILVDSSDLHKTIPNPDEERLA